MVIQTPVAVVVESRAYPEISDKMYNVAAQQLSHHKIECSRISVARIEDLVLATHLCLQATVKPTTSSLRKPIGFVILGVEPDNATSEILYKEAIRSFMGLSLTHTIPITHALFLQNPPIDEQIQMIFNHASKEAVKSFVALYELQQQLLN